MEPAEVAALVAADYDVGTPERCELMSSGINDVFAVTIGPRRYAFRLQPVRKWWTPEEGSLRFELDLLDHFRAHDVPASYPLPRRCGDTLGTHDSRRYSLSPSTRRRRTSPETSGGRSTGSSGGCATSRP